MAQPAVAAGYRPRAASNPLKHIVEDNLEELFRLWDERVLSTYGPLHPRLRELFERFLRCGDPHFGFLRFVCTNTDCGENRYVPHSCKVRGLCPSCGHKRAVAWAERTVEDMLPEVPYVQLVFTIPRVLRKVVLFRRELYGELARVAYAATRDFFREHFPSLDEPVPAMLVVPQSFGDLLIPTPTSMRPPRSGSSTRRESSTLLPRTSISPPSRSSSPSTPSTCFSRRAPSPPNASK